MPFGKITANDLAYFKKIFGPEKVIAPATEHYDHDQLSALKQLPTVAIKPTTTEQVSQILAYANAHEFPVYTRGNGTNFTGAYVPLEQGISLDMTDMKEILEYSPADLTLSVQAGAIVHNDILPFLNDKPFTYIPAPAFDYSSIGGNANNNSSGPQATKYGDTRKYIRGITAVLADGSVEHFGSKVLKSASSYDLKDLVIGSEGTLAVITELELTLIPKPQAQKRLLFPIPTQEDAMNFVSSMMKQGIIPNGADIYGGSLLANWESVHGRHFLDRPDSVFLLITLDAANEERLQDDLKNTLLLGKKYNAVDPVDLGQDESKNVMKDLSTVMLTVMKSSPQVFNLHSIVPRSKLSELINYVAQLEEAEKVRLPNFSHVGDGTLHIYVCQDSYSDQEFQTKLDSIQSKLYSYVKQLGGEISAEHGVGYLKSGFVKEFYGKKQFELMKSIKNIFDPHGILNPQKFIYNDQ